MRYLFRGLIRATGKPVEGHVEATDEDNAFEVLGDNGIVTESVRPDPKSLNLSADRPEQPEFTDAIDSALDSSSMQVPFDALTERYRGKQVWVIDRDKIRRRVAEVVDGALTQSQFHADDTDQTRARVRTAIQGLFNETQNIASQRSMQSVAAEQAAQAQQPMAGEAGPKSGSLDQQIDRLSRLIGQAEGVLGSIALAARRIGTGGGGGRRMMRHDVQMGPEQNEVLLEIFKSNVELIRSLEGEPPAQERTAEANEALTK